MENGQGRGVKIVFLMRQIRQAERSLIYAWGDGGDVTEVITDDVNRVEAISNGRRPLGAVRIGSTAF